MSPAAKGKALLGLLLFVCLFAAVTVFPGRGPEGQGQDAVPDRAQEDTPATPPADPSSGGQNMAAHAPPTASTSKPVSRQGAGDEARESARSAPSPSEEAAAEPEQQDGGSLAGDGSAERGSLSPVERGRAEQAASQFVVYAYGYMGDEVEQYEANVNQAVVPESFARSPGAAHVEAFARRVASPGTESSVIPKSVEVEPAGEGAAEARITFELTDPSGRTLLSQEVRVVSLGAVWRVAEAGELVRVAE